MSLRFKGSDLRPVLTEAIANQCRVILVKDQGVYFLAEHGERRPGGRMLHSADDLILSATATHLSLEVVPSA
ncbi:DUF3085 domain-containing protein [Xanthomonas vasicola]|nr:DUF3085 domain-containing protein [Xanthomonas vasicola]